MWNDGRAVYVEASTGVGKISDQAVDSGAVELNRSGLENPVT